MVTTRHRKLRNNLLLLGCYYSILIGTFSSIVDCRRRRVISKKWFHVWATISNVAIVSSIPLLAHLITSQVTAFEHNWVMLYADRLMAVTRLVIVVLIILERCSRERVLLQMTKLLFDLDVRYFRLMTPQPTLDRRLDCIYITKYMTMLMQSVITFVTTVYIAQDLNWQTLAVAAYLATVQNVIHSTLFQYFTGLMHLLSRFSYLNIRLETLYRSLRHTHMLGLLHGRVCQTLLQLSFIETADFRALALLHFQLTVCARRLSDCLKYITLGVLFCYMLQYIIFGYYAFMVVGSADNDLSFSRLTIAVGSGFYALLHLDLFLFYWNCDAITVAYQRTRNLLPQLHDFSHLPSALSRQTEIFALQLAHSQLQISAGGMFTLNKASSLAMCAYILRTILILVQFEYEHRLKLLRQQLAMDWPANP